MMNSFGGDTEGFKKIGIILTASGAALFLLGILLFFDRALLAMANLLFISGIFLTLGLKRSFALFFGTPNHRIPSILYFLGAFAVLCKYTFIGIFLQVAGIFSLFGDFFPLLLATARRVPIIGQFLSLPGVKAFTDRIITGDCLPL